MAQTLKIYSKVEKGREKVIAGLWSFKSDVLMKHAKYLRVIARFMIRNRSEKPEFSMLDHIFRTTLDIT